MNILKMVTKGLAGFTFMALLAVNVQVGSGNSLFSAGYEQAQADDYLCLSPYVVKCFTGTTEDGEKVTVWGELHRYPSPPTHTISPTSSD